MNNVLKLVYESLKDSVEDIVLPYGNNLLEALRFSVIIFLISLVSHGLGLFTFLSPIGTAIAVLWLLLLYYLERRKYDAVLKLYETFSTRVKGDERGPKGTSSSGEAVRNVGTSTVDSQEISE